MKRSVDIEVLLGYRIIDKKENVKVWDAERILTTRKQRYYSKMPQKADVLLSHDCMFTESKYDMAHSGLAGITYYVYENAVQWHIHGHIHKSYQNSYINGTREKSIYGCEYLEI